MEATVQKADVRNSRTRRHDADHYIAARIRERRMMLGLTQQDLAEMVGTTYQQMHKYEKGINRISAGRLYVLARALGVDVGYFYQGMTTVSTAIKRPEHHRVHLELARNFLSMRNLVHQKTICELTRALKDQEAGLGSEADL